MDNLEKFIRENRSELDKLEPSPEMWGRIKGMKVTRKSIILRYSAAAMITILACTSLFLYLNRGNKVKPSDAVSSVQQELKETELYYNSMFRSIYLKAQPRLTGQPEIEKELNTGVAQLDSICADLKKDLKDNVSNREVIEALIRNYRIKVQLLEEMLNVVDQNENGDKKRNSHEL